MNEERKQEIRVALTNQASQEDLLRLHPAALIALFAVRNEMLAWLLDENEELDKLLQAGYALHQDLRKEKERLETQNAELLSCVRNAVRVLRTGAQSLSLRTMS